MKDNKKKSTSRSRATAEEKLRRKAIRRGRIRRFFPYFMVILAVGVIAYFGSLDKFKTNNTDMDMEKIFGNNYTVSADQISEFYMVSEVASSVKLPTAAVVTLNYNSLTTVMELAQTTVNDKMEKPVVVDLGDCGDTGVINYVVREGDTAESLADRFSSCGVDATMIRWSNDLKKDAGLTVGSEIVLPSQAGFVYTVKSGDTINHLAEKYKSDAERLQTLNQLDGIGLDTDITAGINILIPNGDLPETERPDYVAPVVVAAASPVAYYRTYWTSSNPMPYGWCTWYAWERRSSMGEGYVLPGGLGNANTWDDQLAGSFYVDFTPQAGDVFQTDAGWAGHVGYVESVNGDGTITISDMNGPQGWGAVATRVISAGEWHTYKFIHGRR